MYMYMYMYDTECRGKREVGRERGGWREGI